MGHVKVLLGMFLSLKTLYRKRTVIWPFYFYTIIRTLSFKIKSELSNSFIFDLDIKKEKEKLSDKYKDFTFTEDKIKSISSSIYSYEKYQLEKLEIEISKDNSIISESAQFRYIFGITLREQVEKLHYDNELLLRSLDNIGIR
ncbi:hypothetical protein [Enterococcus faecium]|uniref:hypothetical protein n=3 Tax=Enterococcus faecium TaxID=1352 RepID=UPI0011776E70|nr:hypothetical protein [Enterococcus faecium]